MKHLASAWPIVTCYGYSMEMSQHMKDSLSLPINSGFQNN